MDWLDSTGLDEVRVLDCFGGDGKIWAAVEEKRPGVKVWRTGIEKERGKGDRTRTLYGDNMSYLPHVNLEAFDAIDLDAYGWPCDQLEVVAARVPDKHVFTTVGMYRVGGFPSKVVAAAGMPPEWLRLCVAAITPQGEELWTNFVASLGYTRLVRCVSVGSVTMVYEHLWPVGAVVVD